MTEEQAKIYLDKSFGLGIVDAHRILQRNAPAKRIYDCAVRALTWFPNDPYQGAGYPNGDPRYHPDHPLSPEKNEAARRSGQQVPRS